VRFGLPGLLAGLAVAWGLGVGRSPVAMAEPQRPAEAAGTIAFTSTIPGLTHQWLYLIDTRNQAFAIYKVDPQSANGVIKLEAAREYRYDLKLSEYNNLPPEVSAIESRVKTSK
jgi:hypothetical protein